MVYTKLSVFMEPAWGLPQSIPLPPFQTDMSMRPRSHAPAPRQSMQYIPSPSHQFSPMQSRYAQQPRYSAGLSHPYATAARSSYAPHVPAPRQFSDFGPYSQFSHEPGLLSYHPHIHPNAASTQAGFSYYDRSGMSGPRSFHAPMHTSEPADWGDEEPGDNSWAQGVSTQHNAYGGAHLAPFPTSKSTYINPLSWGSDQPDAAGYIPALAGGALVGGFAGAAFRGLDKFAGHQ